VNAAFDAMSTWRIETANNSEKNSEQVIEKMAVTNVDPDIVALRPSEFPESLPERGDEGLLGRSRDMPSARRCAACARPAAPAPRAAMLPLRRRAAI